MNTKTSNILKIVGFSLVALVLVAFIALFAWRASDINRIDATLDGVTCEAVAEKKNTTDKVRALAAEYSTTQDNLSDALAELQALEDALDEAEETISGYEGLAGRIKEATEKVVQLTAKLNAIQEELAAYQAYSEALDAWLDGLLESKVGDMLKYIQSNPLPHAHAYLGEDCEICEECGGHLCECVRGACREKCEGHEDDSNVTVGDLAS